MKRTWLEQIYAVGIGLVIFGMIIHTPLSVWVTSQYGNYIGTLIKAWKEVLIGLLACVLIVHLMRTKRLRDYSKVWVLRWSALFVVVHVLCMALSMSVSSAIAGLLIDVRFVVFMFVVYAFVREYPTWRPSVQKWVMIAGAVIVALGVLQTMLPKDTLSVLGYSDATIKPYMTVDENPHYIRYASTLRGPNPFGALAAVGVAMSLYWLIKEKSEARRRLFAILLGASFISLYISHARSAFLAAFLGLIAVGYVHFRHKIRPKVWLLVCAAVFTVFAASVYVFRSHPFVSNVILHENTGNGRTLNSNDQHAESLRDGVGKMLVQPIGAGVGSTGSASLGTERPLIIENQYLFIAHEAGWLGLVAFLLILANLIKGFLRLERYDMAITAGMLAMIGLVLPVFTDDAVSLLWWGLAGAVLALKPEKRYNKKHETNKKTTTSA